VSEQDWLAAQFEGNREHLRAVAYGMLGSLSEADDAVQEAWLRLDRSDAETITDMQAWLTTVVGRICLDMLRARRSRRESYVGTWLPEPVVALGDVDGPEQEAVLSEAVGIAMLVVLDQLSPPERLAFVLHDVFGVPFEEVGRIAGRSTEAARQLASRARRRVREAPAPDADLPRQRRVVDAFLAAARAGDMEALVGVLDPDVVFRIDAGRRPVDAETVRGLDAVSKRVLATAPRFAHLGRPALVNGQAGVVVGRGKTVAVLGCTVVGGRIKELNLIVDPDKIKHVVIAT
jgi:RNA polymerase sigma factor (sigma-70 family)